MAYLFQYLSKLASPMNNQRKILYYCECSVVAEGNEGRDGGCQAPTSKAILSGHQKLGGTKLMNS